MGWRETWRETVESFVRELHGGDDRSAAGAEDALIRAIAEARAEVTAVERDLHRTEERLEAEEAAARLCIRRREMAERIGDRDTATVAARFQHRHEERAALLRRKRDVLRDERALTRTELNELLDYVRVDGTGVQPEASAADPSSGPASQPVTDVDAVGFRDLEDRRRERAAEERLEDLKRRRAP